MINYIETARLDRLRNLIRSAEGRFASVEFIKKDGTLRRMQIQPACDKKYVKGEAGCPSGRQGAETRAERYPNLMPIVDVAKKEFRSINLYTVQTVTLDGQTFKVSSL